MKTTILIEHTTRDKLQKYGRMLDSYDFVINKLLKHIDYSAEEFRELD